MDNVDDDELLRKPKTDESDISSEPPLRKLLESSTGTVIVTTRNKGVALDIVGRANNILDVKPMNQAEALDLLQKKLSPLAEHGQGRELAEELEYMPLAIVQAAGYIQSRLPRCSVSQYLLKLRKSDREAVRMLREEAGLLHRDWEAKNSILLTWQISFDYIRKKRPSATDLLSLMSFFDRQGIAESILRVTSNEERNENLVDNKPEESSSEDTDSESNSTADTAFEKEFMMLSDFSLISIESDDTSSTSFTMHRLVQLTVRTWLKVYGQLEQWKEKSIENLSLEFPTGEYENWEECRSLFPHVKAAVSNRPKSQESLRKWATLLYKGAWYAHESGHIMESIEMAEISRDCIISMLGEESKLALISTAMLASVYRRQGRWKEAEELSMQVLEARKKSLGEDHPDTLLSMASLASTLWRQRRWDEAQQLEIQVMEANKAKFGMDHPSTIVSLANLALTLFDNGQLEESEKLQRQVLELQKTKTGIDHPDTQVSMANLAATLHRKGKKDEAEQLQRQVLKAQKITLGLYHPHTLTSMADLAFTLWDQGRLEEAEQLYRQVFETWMKVDADHPEALVSGINLALIMERRGKLEEAEQLQRQVLETQIRLDADQNDILVSMGRLALTLQRQYKWEEAEKLQRQVLESQDMKRDMDHPDTLASMASLARTLWEQDQFEEAEKLERQVLEIRKIKLGVDHPDTLTSMFNLAYTLRSTGQHSEAIDLMRACDSKRQETLGLAHPDTVESSTELAKWESENPTNNSS